MARTAEQILRDYIGSVLMENAKLLATVEQLTDEIKRLQPAKDELITDTTPPLNK